MRARTADMESKTGQVGLYSAKNDELGKPPLRNLDENRIL
jgi:hypothetical protein